MAKKINEKKKVNIKLSNNQSYFIEDINIFLNIRKVYSDLLRVEKSSANISLYSKIIEATNFAVENVYVNNHGGNDEDWS